MAPVPYSCSVWTLSMSLSHQFIILLSFSTFGTSLFPFLMVWIAPLFLAQQYINRCFLLIPRVPGARKCLLGLQKPTSFIPCLFFFSFFTVEKRVVCLAETNWFFFVSSILLYSCHLLLLTKRCLVLLATSC